MNIVINRSQNYNLY